MERHRYVPPLAASTKASINLGSFTRGADSTPLETSTPYGRNRRTTPPTLPGLRPPAMNTLRVTVSDSANLQSHAFPVPPRESADQESSRIGSGQRSASAGIRPSRTLSAFITIVSTSKGCRSSPCSCTMSRPRKSAISSTSATGESMKTPTSAGPSGSCWMIVAASSGLTRRTESQKWKPSRSAPASVAAIAESASQRPQTLTSTSVEAGRIGTGFKRWPSPRSARPGRQLEVNLERSQVAVVDAHDAGAGLEGDRQFRLVMDLEDRPHPVRPTHPEEVGKPPPGQRGDDQENRVRAVGAGFDHLVFVDDE